MFSVPVGGGTPTAIAGFNGTNGFNPLGSLTLSGSTLYGTTNGGGANGLGEVFSLPVGGGIPTVLASFNGTNGVSPVGSLTLSGSTLYGTTGGGGANGYGEVFSLPVSGGTPAVLASFNNTNGSNPNGSLTLSGDGSTFYGTTAQGGANGDGAVFSVPVSGGTPTLLASFNSANGAYPTWQSDAESGNTLYGTIGGGGANGKGECSRCR